MAANLDRYLRLTIDGAGSQWRQILARRVVPAGRRPEDFRPVEVVLSFGLFFVTTPTR